jgi:hypothetical protein
MSNKILITGAHGAFGKLTVKNCWLTVMKSLSQYGSQRAGTRILQMN